MLAEIGPMSTRVPIWVYFLAAWQIITSLAAALCDGILLVLAVVRERYEEKWR